MMIDLEKKLIVIDQNGNEKEMTILFTFDSEDYNKQYVLFYDQNDDEMIFASSYDDQGNLTIVDDPQEWEMVEEVLEAFSEDQDQKH